MAKQTKTAGRKMVISRVSTYSPTGIYNRRTAKDVEREFTGCPKIEIWDSNREFAYKKYYFQGMDGDKRILITVHACYADWASSCIVSATKQYAREWSDIGLSRPDISGLSSGGPISGKPSDINIESIEFVGFGQKSVKFSRPE